jgi:hypothetical protein
MMVHCKSLGAHAATFGLTSLLLATGAHAAAFGKKELVDTAHPVLKKAFAEHGRLTKADFAVASATPWEAPPPQRAHATPRQKASKLGGYVDESFDDSLCDLYVQSGDLCFDGDASDIDDDTVLAAPSTPGACVTCGYFTAEDAVYSDWMDCQTCEDGYEIIVFYDDCTGGCVAADSTSYYTDMGFGTLATSSCVAIDPCYDDDAINEYPTDGTVSLFVDDDDGSSYSYSYAYSCYEGCASCDGPGNMDCDSCDNGCDVEGDADQDGYGSCPESCDDDDCADSPTWHKVGVPWKDCAWVSAYSARCAVKGEDDGHKGKSLASYACSASCGACHGDSASWYKKNAPAKTCQWVSAWPDGRCAVKGFDGTLAADECPHACGEDDDGGEGSVQCDGADSFCDCEDDCDDDEGAAWCQCEEAQACCARR